MSEEWVPFDKRNAAILKSAGFSITDEPGHGGETASVEGEMAVYVVQIADGRLRLSVDLPDGGIINADIVVCTKCGRHPVIRTGGPMTNATLPPRVPHERAFVWHAPPMPHAHIHRWYCTAGWQRPTSPAIRPECAAAVPWASVPFVARMCELGEKCSGGTHQRWLQQQISRVAGGGELSEPD